MRTEYEPPAAIYLDQDDFERYGRTTEALQKANCAAAQLLLKLCDREGGKREGRETRLQIQKLTSWMNLIMDNCERIVAQTTPTDLIINLHVHTHCLDCWENARLSRPDWPEQGGVLLGADEAWAHQVGLNIARSMRKELLPWLEAVC